MKKYFRHNFVLKKKIYLHTVSKTASDSVSICILSKNCLSETDCVHSYISNSEGVTYPESQALCQTAL